MNPTIKKTDKYNMFKLKKGNRKILRASVNRLIRSIENKNMLAANPIIVNENMEIIDGQHRLEACRILKIPVYYVVFNPASLAEIQMLNSNMKPWSAREFLESYIAIGKEDYKTFKEFWEKYKFPLSSTMTLLNSPDLVKASDLSGKFRAGQFQIADLSKSTEIAERIKELLNHLDPSVRTNTRFYEAIFRILRKYPEYFDDILEKVGGGLKVYRTYSTNEYLAQFERILNKGHFGKPIRLY